MHSEAFIPCWDSVENQCFIPSFQGLICRLNEAKIMHIAIAGNIGSGKTTLTTLLAKHYRYEPHFEQVDDNPYLNDFYKDMQRWSFNLQVFFLRSRFAQLAELQDSGKKVIQDRTIYEDAHIFAPNLHSMGLMSSRDFKNYQDLFELMENFISPPDLMIYLRASVPKLVENIQKRGRDYEEAIRLDYLNRLNERYEAWISTYSAGKLLIIDVDENGFHESKADLGAVIESVDAELHGLFV
jgi:deoxyadenosine/deoxycytidine kinase